MSRDLQSLAEQNSFPKHAPLPHRREIPFRHCKKDGKIRRRQIPARQTRGRRIPARPVKNGSLGMLAGRPHSPIPASAASLDERAGTHVARSLALIQVIQRRTEVTSHMRCNRSSQEGKSWKIPVRLTSCAPEPHSRAVKMTAREAGLCHFSQIPIYLQLRGFIHLLRRHFCRRFHAGSP